MPSRYHVIVEKPFDTYDKPGLRAIISKRGYEAFLASKKHLGFLKLEAEDLDDGTIRVADDKGNLDTTKDPVRFTGLKEPLFQSDGNLLPNFRELLKGAPKADRNGAGPSVTR